MNRLSYDHAQACKHEAIEEWWDVHINRPVAGVLVRALLNTQVTANQVTVLSGLSGVGAAVCLARGWTATAAMLLMAALIFDCADGQLARVRGGGTFVGRLMDGYVDWTTAVALHLGLWGYFDHYDTAIFGRQLGGLGSFGLALLCGVSLAIHSTYFDLVKNRFLERTGLGRSEVDDPDDIREKRDMASGTERIALTVYAFYCQAQARMADTSATGRAGPRSRREQRISYQLLLPHLRLWSVVGPTIHLVILAFAMFLSHYRPSAILGYVLFTVVIANLWTVAMLVHANRVKSQLNQALDGLR